MVVIERDNGVVTGVQVFEDADTMHEAGFHEEDVDEINWPHWSLLISQCAVQRKGE